MSELLKRHPVAGRLAIATLGSMMLAVLSWILSKVVSADFPQRPVLDLGHAGPWVASYARAVAAGSWLVARACLMLAAVLLAVNAVSHVMRAIRKVVRRPDRPMS